MTGMTIFGVPKVIVPRSCWFLAVLVLALASCLGCSPQGAAHARAEMRLLLSIIEPPLGANSVEERDSGGSDKALVGMVYRWAGAPAELRAHYDKRLKKQGWEERGEQRRTNWGNDTGGWIRRYRKGPYRATLTYAGDKLGEPWTFSFTLTWNALRLPGV